MKTALTAALFFLAAEAVACGYCVEDKIASTYDHAIVTSALARGHHVAFFHVDGAPVTRRALEQAAAAVPGIDKGSAQPNRNKVGKVTRAQLKKIAEIKMADLNASDLDSAMRMIAGTARSMGLEVTD